MLTKRAEKKSEVPKIHLLIYHWKCVSQCRSTFWNFSQHEKCDSPLSALCLNLNALCLFGDFCFCRTIKFVPSPPHPERKVHNFCFPWGFSLVLLFVCDYVVKSLERERPSGWGVGMGCSSFVYPPVCFVVLLNEC